MMPPMIGFRIRAARWAGWVLLVAIAALSIVPPTLRPETGAPHMFEHAAIFAATGASFGLGYSRRPKLTLIGLVIFAAAIEAAQRLVPGRASQRLYSRCSCRLRRPGHGCHYRQAPAKLASVKATASSLCLFPRAASPITGCINEDGGGPGTGSLAGFSRISAASWRDVGQLKPLLGILRLQN